MLSLIDFKKIFLKVSFIIKQEYHGFMKDAYLNISEIAHSLKIDHKTLMQWVHEGKFPPPKKIINDRFTIWSYAVIEKWIAQQKENQEWFNDIDPDS